MGIVHPKMKIVIYSPSSCSKPVWISSAEHKRYFGKIWVPKQAQCPTDFHNILYFISPYYGSQWSPGPVWLPIFFKVFSFGQNVSSPSSQGLCKISWNSGFQCWFFLSWS